MELDFFGVAATAVLAFAFSLLLVGVYSEKQREKSLNLVKHGFLSVAATLVTLFLVFWSMIPNLSDVLGTADAIRLLFTWLHVALGVVTIVAVAVVIAAWVRKPLGELGCVNTWKLMTPILATWAASLILGAIIYFYGP